MGKKQPIAILNCKFII